MRRQTLLFVTVVLLVVGFVPAATEVLCTNPSGVVFVRMQCRGNETQVDPLLSGYRARKATRETKETLVHLGLGVPSGSEHL